MARALILDFDGVTTDTDLATEQVWRALFGWYGSVAGAQHFDEKAHDWSLQDLHQGLRSIANRRIEADRFDREWGLVWSTLAWNGLPARSDAIGMLRAAKQAGWRTAIATNAQSWYVERHLRAWGIEDLVDAVEAVSGTTMAKKPAPDVFLAAAVALKVDPPDAVAIEDTDSGLQAALSAGMTAVGLRTRWRDDVFVGAALVVEQLAALAPSLGLSID